jgi:molybdopterin-containing oxidoreductase family iron-sulfur binding subunit
MSSMKNEMPQGREYWKSLDQLADTPEFREFLHREFPQGASELKDPITRRTFLSLMGASVALAGLAGCRKPVEKIIPYVAAPEEIVPGVPNYYATTMPFMGDAFGLIVESHEGRPTKIEGNPEHPATRGRSNTFIQGSILDLYDPDRSKMVLHDGRESNWSDFVAFWRGLYEKYSQNGGQGLAILSEPFVSPTLFLLRQIFAKTFPNARWATYEPVDDRNIAEGLRIAIGNGDHHPIYHFDKPGVILALDSDFVYTESDNIRNAQGFMDGRRVSSEKDGMNRLYVVESHFTNTGAMADHRLRMPASMIGRFAAALALELKKQGVAIRIGAPNNYSDDEFERDWIRIVAADLVRARGKGLVVAGRRQQPAVHALVFAINAALGYFGNTVSFLRNVDREASDAASLAALAEDITRGEITALAILGGNPVYNAPADLEFASLMRRVENTIHLGSHVDESARKAKWHVPLAHYLESWGDARSIDSTVSVIQPLIAPLYGGVSSVEMLNLLATGIDARGYDIVRKTWQNIIEGEDFESAWRRVLHDGFLRGSAGQAVELSVDSDSISKFIAENRLGSDVPGADNPEIAFAPSPTLYDGRFANNGWLQELPDPQTKITWDNAALISPQAARNSGVGNGEIIALRYRGREIEAPAWIMPGHADNSVTLYLGYGQKSVGRVGNGIGFDAYALRSIVAPYFDTGLNIAKTGRIHKLSTTQNHHTMEGRPIVREATLEHYREEPNFANEGHEIPPLYTLRSQHELSEQYQWGMAIDLNVCIGCNACAVACYSENNIPIVGKEQVARGREMAWIRVDRYFVGDKDDPEIVHQPVPCMHCENAPCEEVCPVTASLHDREGLNLQVYNRCIGTRYCSNNCPYKVRRFNFFNYTGKTPEPLKMANNPDVTVRSRGVMEKCTYCLQRIVRAKKTAKDEGRKVADGEFTTACAQACPTDAIVFGNIADSESRVSRIKMQNRNYGMLAEYNTKPRTTYLARLRNLNPELKLLEEDRIS